MTTNAAKSSGAWTLPILCVGLALLACSAILPQVEENRQALWEREKLQRDLAHLDSQIETNEAFLTKVGQDPSLSERLAQRQMKMIRTGSGVLDLNADPARPNEMSPFLLVSVPPPAPLAAYTPPAGPAHYFLERRPSTYVMGAAFFLVAVGLILGGSPPKPNEDRV